MRHDLTQAELDAALAANLRALGLDPTPQPPLEERVFACLVELIREKGELPTQDEIAARAGLSSQSPVSHAFRKLLAQGRVLRTRHPSHGKTAYVPVVVTPS